MSANPGWYADPAGSSELRYFDGAVWAADTVARELVTGDRPQAAVPAPSSFGGPSYFGGTVAPPRQWTPAPAPGITPAAGMRPGTAVAPYASNVDPHARFRSGPPRPRQSRLRLVGVAAVTLAVAAGLGLATKGSWTGDHSTSTSAGSRPVPYTPPRTGAPSTGSALALPSSLAGYTEDESLSARAEATFSAKMLAYPHASAAYTSDSGRPKFYVAAFQLPVLASDVTMERAVRSGVARSVTGSWSVVDVPGVGGTTECADADISGVASRVCVMADDGLIGTFFLFEPDEQADDQVQEVLGAIDRNSGGTSGGSGGSSGGGGQPA